MNKILIAVVLMVSVLFLLGAKTTQSPSGPAKAVSAPEVLPATGDPGMYIFLATLVGTALALILLYVTVVRTERPV